MDRTRTAGNQPNRFERALSALKLVSRLLGHELHSQNAPRLTLSREEVIEIQSCVDLFIEDALRSTRGSAQVGPAREVEIPTVEARVN